jgi:amino acid transporter
MGLFNRNDPDSDDDGHVGWWLLGIAALIGLAVAGILFLIGVMAYAFGILGLLAVILGLALFVAWMQDRRDKQRGSSATG